MRDESKNIAGASQFQSTKATARRLVSMAVVLLGFCCVLSCNRLPKVIIPKELQDPEYVIDKNGLVDGYSFRIDQKKFIQFNTVGGLDYMLSDTPSHKIDTIIANNPDWEFVFVVAMPLKDSLRLRSVLDSHGCDFPVIVDTENVFAKKNGLGKLTAVGWFCDGNNRSHGIGCIGTPKSSFDQRFPRIKRQIK